MTRQIKFHRSLVNEIVTGKKRCTVRYDWEELPEPGENVKLVNADSGFVFAEAVVSATGKTTIQDFQEHRFPQHRQYDNVHEAIHMINSFYPEENFAPETELDVIWFRL